MNNLNFNNSRNFAPYYNQGTPTTATNNIIWVQGIEGAKAWQLAPNSMAILLDSETDGKMYIKVTDNIGMGSLRIFSYVEEVAQPAQVNATTNNLDLSQYVKKDELSVLIKEIINNEQLVSTTEQTTESVQPRVITVKK